eukprot:5191401-Ditylum_brightwellii.AAC.1
MANAPTTTVPILGEIPLDGSITVLLPAAGIAVIGFIYSIVVAFSAKDTISEGVRKVGQNVNIPEMKYTPKEYDESVCRGLCSSQEQDLEGMRTFLGKISSK